MTSFAHLKLDFYDDPSILKNESIPDFVKKASVETGETLSKLSHDCFALLIETPDGSIHGKYPIHTPADTWLSMVTFEKTAHKLPLEMQERAAYQLVKAAVKWEIGGNSDITMGLAKQASMREDPNFNLVRVTSNMEYFQDSVELSTEKRAAYIDKLSPEWFAVVRDGVKRYPLHTPELTKKAALWFEENNVGLSPSVKREFSNNLIKAATRHSVVLNSPTVFKYANEEYADNIPVMIQVRKQYVLDDTQMHLLDDLLHKTSSLKPSEFAKVLTAVDKITGIDKYWGREFPDPYETTFAMPKLADYSYCDSHDDISGNELREFTKKKDFREKLQAYVSKDVIDELESSPVEVFDSLPKPEKRLIMDLIKEK